MVRLTQARPEDATEILAMQVRAFMPIYEKYHDTETSPATENADRVYSRICDPATRFWFIEYDGERAGAIRVQRVGGGCRISPLFVLPAYQGKGVAQRAMLLAEAEYPDVDRWELATIAQEAGNCHLYEKMGYIRTGESTVINEFMTIIGYVKHIER